MATPNWMNTTASWWQRPMRQNPIIGSAWRSWFTGSLPAVFGSGTVPEQTKRTLGAVFFLNQLMPYTDPFTQAYFGRGVSQVLAQTAPVYGDLLGEAMQQAAQEYAAALSRAQSTATRRYTPGQWFSELPSRMRGLLEAANVAAQAFAGLPEHPAYQAAQILGDLAAAALPGEGRPATAEEMMLWEAQIAQALSALQQAYPELADYISSYIAPSAMPQWGAAIGGLGRTGSQRSWWS